MNVVVVVGGYDISVCRVGWHFGEERERVGSHFGMGG